MSIIFFCKYHSRIRRKQSANYVKVNDEKWNVILEIRRK